jgi:hypothetical protein
MSELCSVSGHENGYTVHLHKPEKDRKKSRHGGYAYEAPETHVAETHEKALDIMRGHMEKHAKKSDNQGKTDKLADAARAGYRKLTGGKPTDSNDEDVHAAKGSRGQG